MNFEFEFIKLVKPVVKLVMPVGNYIPWNTVLHQMVIYKKV